MKQKVKTILIGLLIGIVAFPTITLGGTFVSSLIQGKTVEEAVQILAGQIDSLIGRVEVIETKQEVQEQIMKEVQTALEKEQTKQEAYNEFRRAYDKVWLYGHTEEETIRNTRMYCQKHIEEGDENSSFCLLADELERTWEIYQNSLK
jgi:TolA-binding protein